LRLQRVSLGVAVYLLVCLMGATLTCGTMAHRVRVASSTKLSVWTKKNRKKKIVFFTLKFQFSYTRNLNGNTKMKDSYL